MSSGKQANDEWMGTNTSTNTINNTKTKTNTNICPLENKLMKNGSVQVQYKYSTNTINMHIQKQIQIQIQVLWKTSSRRMDWYMYCAAWYRAIWSCAISVYISVCVYSVQIQIQFGKIWSAAQSHLANKLMNKTISAVTT